MAKWRRTLNGNRPGSKTDRTIEKLLMSYVSQQEALTKGGLGNDEGGGYGDEKETKWN